MYNKYEDTFFYMTMYMKKLLGVTKRHFVDSCWKIYATLPTYEYICELKAFEYPFYGEGKKISQTFLFINNYPTYSM